MRYMSGDVHGGRGGAGVEVRVLAVSARAAVRRLRAADLASAQGEAAVPVVQEQDRHQAATLQAVPVTAVRRYA